MHNSKIIAIFLAALLFTSALIVSPTSFIIGDAKAAGNDNRDITYKEKNYDKYNYEEYDYDNKKSSYYGYNDDGYYKKYPNEKKEYYNDYYDDKFSTHGQEDNIVDLQCEECLKYWLDTLYKGQVKNFVNALATYINHINWGDGVYCTVLDAPINPPDNKLPGVECLPVADDKKK